MIPAGDIRDRIFAGVGAKRYLACITAEQEGILSGIPWLKGACGRLGIDLVKCKRSRARTRPAEIVAALAGSARQIALAEEEIIGWVAKASGIATAAWKARQAAGRDLQVVCGAWKKMPLPIKELIRQAILDGGIAYRIADQPFLYLDKNYVRILGGVAKALRAVCALKGHTRVVQLKGAGWGLLRDAAAAAQQGAHILMIDTGRREDIGRVDAALRARGLRRGVRLAFGGNVAIEDLPVLQQMPLEIVDIGRAVVDAPLIGMRMDVAGRI